MEVREIRVEFKKTVSDGNYGNETATVSFLITLDESVESYLEVTSEMVGQASDEVLRILHDSTSEGVRLALETHEERQARWQREQDEYRARYPLEQAPSDEPIAGSGEMPLKDEDSPF